MAKKSDKSTVQESLDMGGTAVMDAPEGRASDPALSLIEHLKESGTPFKMQEAMRTWLRTNKDATAEALYRHLEEKHASKEGTLRKAGRFCFGPDFEPASVVEQAPEEEILRLRQENERLRESTATLSAEKHGLAMQNNHLYDRINELQSQVAFLKIGKTPDELKTVGL